MTSKRRSNPISEVVWITLGVLALAWELVGVFAEDETGIEPLTGLVRDRLFRLDGGVGVVFEIVFAAFWTWLLVHWLRRRRGIR